MRFFALIHYAPSCPSTSRGVFQNPEAADNYYDKHFKKDEKDITSTIDIETFYTEHVKDVFDLKKYIDVFLPENSDFFAEMDEDLSFSKRAEIVACKAIGITHGLESEIYIDGASKEGPIDKNGFYLEAGQTVYNKSRDKEFTLDEYMVKSFGEGDLLILSHLEVIKDAPKIESDPSMNEDISPAIPTNKI